MPAKDYYLPARRLVSQDDAAIIERANVPRSKFSGSWTRKTTFDAGYIVPFLLDEILPGDHMRYNVTAYIRMATPLFPLFDNQRIDTFFFFVPARILWDNWVYFMGEQAQPNASIAYTIPQIITDNGGHIPGSIYDHFALPVNTTVDSAQPYTHSALPLRAYNRIYNEWFRDQNISAGIANLTDDGPDGVTSYALRKRAKSHDYFTSALPWPQKFTAPTLPLGGRVELRADVGLANPLGAYSTITADYEYLNASTAQLEFVNGPPTIAERLYVDLATATGVSINTFRQAFLVQQLLERDARGGTRYVEILKSHFGVTSPDFRLQRPEYIGGGQTPLQLTPVAQTAPTAGAPVGALGAAGTSVGQHTASYASTEHGYIIGLINVRTELSYQQGLHRMWTRNTRYDFYWPSLAGLGEQSILRKELYCRGNVSGEDETVFGYQEAWHTYRTRYSEVTGIMRSGGTPTLDPWHLAQFFTTAPLLNETFIHDTPPMARVLAAGELAEDQQYLADILINREAVRAIPAFGTPANLGRF
jgi:hypothetical protein